MTTFHYKAVNAEGRPFEETLDAKDKFELYKIIKKKEGVLLISVEEKDHSLGSITVSFFGGVGAHDKILFARNLASMLDAGLPITRGLSIMERQAGRGELKRILQNFNDSLAKGVTLSEAMKQYP